MPEIIRVGPENSNMTYAIVNHTMALINMCYTHPQMTVANNFALLFAQENRKKSWSRCEEHRSSHDGTYLIATCLSHGTQVFSREIARKEKVLTNSFHNLSQGMWEYVSPQLSCRLLRRQMLCLSTLETFPYNACLFQGHLWVHQRALHSILSRVELQVPRGR